MIYSKYEKYQEELLKYKKRLPLQVLIRKKKEDNKGDIDKWI